MTSRFFGVSVAWACAVVVCCAGLALTEDVEIHLKNTPEGTTIVESHFTVKASSQAVWDTLTDYDGISRFVSSIRSSRVVEKTTDHLLVQQTARAKVLFFSRDIHVLLRIQEDPYHSLHFEDISAQDFTLYQGSWRVTPVGNSIRVSYFLTAKRRFSVPDFLAHSVMKKTSQTMLEETRQAILNRGSLARH